MRHFWESLFCILLLQEILPTEQKQCRDDKGTIHNEGIMLIFSCNTEKGYVLDGPGKISCQGDGTWTGSFPSCKNPVQCRDDKGTMHNVGTALRFSCNQDDGFVLKGSAKIVCKDDGSWTGSPASCVLKENKKCTDASGDTHNPGVSLMFSCGKGTVLKGAGKITCKEDGTWTSPPGTCESDSEDQMMCWRPEASANRRFSIASAPNHVRVDQDAQEFPSWSILRFDCENGYLLSGSREVACDKSGMWSPDIPSCIEDCGLSPLSSAGQRISYGERTRPGDFPWMVAIQQVGGTVVCGGALLDRRTVLTAAHCFNTSLTYMLHFGKYFRNNDEDDNQVFNRTRIQIVIHRYYNRRTFSNDIALIKFEPSLIYTPRVQPVCLPRPEDTWTHLTEGQSGIVTGWGITENRALSNVLLMANLTNASVEECSQAYAALAVPQQLDQGMFCAKSVPQERDDEGLATTTCVGDSGSPFVFLNRETLRFSVEGVVSFGEMGQCGITQYPVFTKVSNFLSWIHRSRSVTFRGNYIIL